MFMSLRGVDPQVIDGLTEMAKKRNISREELLRNICTDAVELQGIKECENRYLALIRKLEIVLEENTKMMEHISLVLMDVMDQIRKEES